MPVLTGRLKYLRKYEDYAAQFGKGVRTVKRWAGVGKAKNDKCPLDELAKLPAWWAKNMVYSIPADVLAICLGQAVSAPDTAAMPPQPVVVDSSARPPDSSSRSLINVQDLAAIGLKENVERLSKIHRANLELLEKAFGGSSDIELQLRQRNAEKSARMLSDAQRNFDSYQKEHGELVVLSDVKRDLLRVHSAMAQSLVSIFIGNGISRDRAISSVDTWFRHLRESRFASGTTPELRPAAATAA